MTQHRRRIPTAIHHALVWLILISGMTAWGQEQNNAGKNQRVWYEPLPPMSNQTGFLPRSLIEAKGEIVDFTAEAVRIQQANVRQADSIAAQRIVWIAPDWQIAEAASGMKAFEEGDYPAAIQQLTQALPQRPPVWQQQWILAHLTAAAHQVGKHAEALQLIGLLQQSNPPSFMLGLMPIHWTNRPLPASAVAAARQAIGAEDPAVRLVAASWLLSSAEDRVIAERTLDAIVNQRDAMVLARMAAFVRWRRTPVPQIAAASERWIAAVDQLPIALQGGPLLFIADRFDAIGSTAEAKEWYLKVALLHHENRPLAGAAQQALFEQANAAR